LQQRHPAIQILVSQLHQPQPQPHPLSLPHPLPLPPCQLHTSMQMIPLIPYPSERLSDEVLSILSPWYVLLICSFDSTTPIIDLASLYNC
jgi:hypothetical protein